MRIGNIRLINFRNYNILNVKLNKNINIILGNNAQGKTNLLESIYMAAIGSSFRTNKDRDIIKFDKSQSYIGIDFVSNRINKLIEVKLEEEKPKRIKLNKLEIKNLKELESGLAVVLFSPDDLDLVKGGPQGRRDFLDKTISELKPLYKHNIARYNKILFQRNNLLKSKKPKKDIEALIEIFNIQLIEVGTDIIKYRYKFLTDIDYIGRAIHGELTEKSEVLSIIYKNNLELDNFKSNKIKLKFKEGLERSFEKDLRYGTTSIGPHRDDFKIYINKKDARSFASQGQQRTAVLSLKLSEVNIIKKHNGEYPILLLDDVFSELDEKRREVLTKYLKYTQTIITSTDDIDLNDIKGFGITTFNIKNGELVRVRRR